MPNIFDLLVSEDQRESNARGVKGVAVGIVSKNKDDEGLGRVKLHFPWLSNENETDWVRVATLMAGSERGSFFLPDVDDEVLVVFEHGDINRPIVIGALWNKEDKAPARNSDGHNDVKMIRTRSGHELIFDDGKGKERVEIKTKGGHKMLLDESTGSEKIVIKDKTGQNSIEIDSGSGSISIKSSSSISLNAPNIDISGSGAVNIKAPVISIQASGTLTCQAQAIMNQASGAITCMAGGPLALKGTPVALG